MESFFEAFINCGHRVFGQKLKPFCLRHCLYLEAIGSPIMRIVNGEEVKIERHDLEVAAIICSADGDILKALTSPQFTMFFYSFRRALKEYLDYLTDYLALPEMWDNSDTALTYEEALVKFPDHARQCFAIIYTPNLSDRSSYKLTRIVIG